MSKNHKNGRPKNEISGLERRISDFRGMYSLRDFTLKMQRILSFKPEVAL
jgi:hypothetical protein